MLVLLMVVPLIVVITPVTVGGALVIRVRARSAVLCGHRAIVVPRPSECTLQVGRTCLSNATAHGSVAECTTDRFIDPGRPNGSRCPSDRLRIRSSTGYAKYSKIGPTASSTFKTGVMVNVMNSEYARVSA